VEARLVPRGRFGTWSEALALAALVAERGAGDLLVCTSGYHLPRALLAVRRALRDRNLGEVAIRALPVAEPPDSALAAGRRLRSVRAWWALAREGVKWVAYAAFIRVSGRSPSAR
jgi:uncharacterized SAM-binding protein YcdF (DUF218 family)